MGVVSNAGNPVLGKLLQEDCQSSGPAGTPKSEPVRRDSSGAISSWADPILAVMAVGWDLESPRICTSGHVCDGFSR